MSTPSQAPAPRFKLLSQGLIPLGIVSLVMLLVVPVPPVVLDLLLAANLSLAVVIMLTAMSIKDALAFSVFPALLLITTLARLALNVSSTRSILLHGYAGKVIEGFGNFVVGGNLVVGLIIFLILVVIQFAVVTAGAGRVAEVAARFSLDAMPGLQMAVDADLNAGLIDEDTARERRARIARQADFAGAMDGGSKFIKGDAIAGVVIVLINLVGGIAVGVLQQGMPIGEALQHFSLLSVGDGLVSQIPALLISIAAGLVVTRVPGTDHGLGGELSSQLSASRPALRVAAVVLAILGIAPGLPTIPFWIIAAVFAFLGWRPEPEEPFVPEEPEVLPGSPDDPDLLLDQVRVDPLRLELAADLLELMDPNRANNLGDRVSALRRTIAADLGLIVPPVHTADVTSMPAGHYVIKVNGVPVAEGEAPAGSSLVLSDGRADLPGRPVVDPVFGMPAVWMSNDLARTYAMTGLPVIDRGNVIVTHLSETVRKHANDLLTRQDVRTLLDAARRQAPAVVDEVDGDRLTLAEIQAVLTNLLEEGIPITNLVRILEAVSARAREQRTVEALTEAARAALGPVITHRVRHRDQVSALTLDPNLERHLTECLRIGEQGSWLAVDAQTLEGLLQAIASTAIEVENDDLRPVLVCSPALRPAVSRLVAAARPDLRVVAYTELSSTARVTNVGEIRLEQPAFA